MTSAPSALNDIKTKEFGAWGYNNRCWTTRPASCACSLLRLPILLLTLATALAACQPKDIPMTPDEAQRVDALTAKMNTRCVGRFLVDIPDSFVLNSEFTTEIEGVKVAVQPMSKWMFERTLETREVVLQRTKFLGHESDLPYVRRTIPTPPPSLGKIFDRAASKHTGRLSRTFEILAWRDGYEIQAFVNATDTNFPEDANDSIAKQLKTDVEEKLAHLLKVYERVSGRQDTEIPGKAGLCIPNGFVVGASREGQETDAVYHLADAPDVWFGFSSSDAIKEKTSLFDRAPAVEQAMQDDGSKTLRKGKRTLHGQDYEEWLWINTPEQDDIRGSFFLMHGNETRTVREQPFIEFKLRNGNRIPVPELSMVQKDKLRLNEVLTKATLSDAEALAIWDKVSATLRPRPGAF